MSTFVLKRKTFSLFGMFGQKKKIAAPINNSPKWDGKIIYDPITFEEMENEDYYPSLVLMGVDMRNAKPEDWTKLMDGLNKNGMFVGNKYGLMAARTLSDNIKGNNGLSVHYVKFTPETEINSGTRLAWGNKVKWADDFANNYHSWYKSGR